MRYKKAPPWCVHTIYCDESGATGNELLDPNQEFFVYASIAFEPSEAAMLLDDVVARHRVQGKELKGKNLLSHSVGRNLVNDLIGLTGEKSHLVIHHKKYALAAKFFEYMFEPVLAAQSSMFYEVGFHKFVSNLLYAWTLAQEQRADDILRDFARAMRGIGPVNLPVFSGNSPGIVQLQDPLEQIATFCFVHRAIISNEIEGLGEIDLGKWSLDLTSTSLFSVLSHWGEKFDQLAVYCDDAKPLRQVPVPEVFVNREEKIYQVIGGRRKLFTPNLAHIPKLVRSEDFPGIQIADVLASACRKALQDRSDKDSNRWINALTPRISGESVWHDLERVDLDSPKAMLNAVILLELVERSVKGKDVLDGMGDFIAAAAEMISGDFEHLPE